MPSLSKDENPVICPKCHQTVAAGSKFCEFCGAKLGARADSRGNSRVITIPCEECALAKGLPSWNIEPPQILVRRKSML